MSEKTGDRAMGEGGNLGRSKRSSILQLLDLEKQREIQEGVLEKQIGIQHAQREKKGFGFQGQRH